MEVGELRRLAIRMARHTDLEDDSYCGECGAVHPTHTPDCPIAELEAEEAASEAGIADGARVTMASGDGWSVDLRGEWETISFDLKDGTTLTGYARKIPTVKTAGEFAGEFG